jgi:hypothetical protein
MQEQRDARLEASCKPQKIRRASEQASQRIGSLPLAAQGCAGAHTHQNAQRNKRHTDFLRAVRATGYGLRARLQEATDGGRPCGSGGDPALHGAHLADTHSLTLTCALGEPEHPHWKTMVKILKSFRMLLTMVNIPSSYYD